MTAEEIKAKVIQLEKDLAILRRQVAEIQDRHRSKLDAVVAQLERERKAEAHPVYTVICETDKALRKAINDYHVAVVVKAAKTAAERLKRTASYLRKRIGT